MSEIKGFFKKQVILDATTDMVGEGKAKKIRRKLTCAMSTITSITRIAGTSV